MASCTESGELSLCADGKLAGMNNHDDDDGFAKLRKENFETSEELNYRTGNRANTKRRERIGFAIAVVAILLIVATAVVLLKVL